MKFDKNEFAKTLGNRVREVRKYRGFTIEELASDAEMESRHLGRIEYGNINTSVFHIYRLCYSLNVNLGELFGAIPLKPNKTTNDSSNN
ncbi:helix-turn-helix domain-containing protein [Aquirufa nivalisilvae]